jgi:ATP-dependent RNA helicase RhlE
LEFCDLKLDARILDAVEKEGYVTPSPIQQQAVPLALARRDILGCAQTGTGKTAAFAMPILHLLSLADNEKAAENEAAKPQGWAQPKKEFSPIRALILSPTRELSMQIHESFCTYGKFLKLKYALVMGGASQHLQEKALARGADVLVATPGRLLDLYAQGVLNLRHVEIFVLDEADKMLDMGFIHDIRRIIEIIPKKRQTMFFTATMSPDATRLSEKILNNPANVTVTPACSTVEATTQTVYFTDKVSKQDLLVKIILNDSSIRSALIFTRTKYGADRLSKKLKASGINSLSIHGDKTQNARQHALASFKNGTIRALVATDIAARGIDVDDLSHVINFEMPNTPETYVHRIGRTGRAGKAGIAISLCDFDEIDYLEDIEKLINKKISVSEDDEYPITVFVRTQPKPQQNRSVYRRR